MGKDYVSHAYLEGPMMAISLKDSGNINEVYHNLKTSIDEDKYTVYVNGNFPKNGTLMMEKIITWRQSGLCPSLGMQ